MLSELTKNIINLSASVTEIRLNALLKGRLGLTELKYNKFKVCIVGDGGVGKTTLVNRYLTGVFRGDYKLTIGADFYVKKIEIDDQRITLQIWDFAGEDRYRFLLPAYVQGSSGAIFMYDITRYSSFNNFEEWMSVFKESFHRKEIDVPIIMVGGKLDLEHNRAVSVEDAREVAEQHNFNDYIECSSKTGGNVEHIFEKISRLMMEQAEVQESEA
ncbi:MAG: GTP-binding protein [Candidatus Lokiarchaeota archaeon]|nr:GTP-binding protein [Candidatus Lokiarchaeota archaeon]